MPRAKRSRSATNGAADGIGVRLTNGQVIDVVNVLMAISGKETDATEQRIMRILIKLRPVSEAIQARLRKAAEEFHETNDKGELVCTDHFASARREAEIKALEWGVLTAEPFARRDFKKLAGKYGAMLGPLFADEEPGDENDADED